MLESSGYADSRIITPIRTQLQPPSQPLFSYVKPTPDPPTSPRGRTAALIAYPPYSRSSTRLRSTSRSPPSAPVDSVRSLRPSTSRLLLRGVMTLWNPSVPTKTRREEELNGDDDEASSVIFDEDALIRESSTRMWAERVARESTMSPPVFTTNPSIPTLSSLIQLPESTPDLIPTSDESKHAPLPSNSISPRATSFTFAPRPLVLASSSSSTSSFSSTTMGRRVFSRPSTQADARERFSHVGFQSLALGSTGGSNFYDEEGKADHSSPEGVRVEYDDADDDEDDIPIPSTSQGIISSTLRHWQSLMSFSNPASMTPSVSNSTITPSNIVAKTPLPYSSSLPRPDFLDAPYTSSRPLSSVTNGNLPVRQGSSSVPAQVITRKPSRISAAPMLLKRVSNPALRAKPIVTKSNGDGRMS